MTREPDETVLEVTVVRTGGIAGMSRRWSVTPEDAEDVDWVSLVTACPWHDGGSPTTGADRYRWAVSARCAARREEADLADQDVHGPWRALIDAVRAASAPPTRTDRSGPRPASPAQE
jgi:hypothetical protein